MQIDPYGSGKQSIALSRICVACTQSKPMSEFPNLRARVSSYCRDCQRAYDRRYYAERGRIARLRARRAAERMWMVQLKNGIPCAECSEVFPAWVMQWDHLPGMAKVEAVSAMVGSRRRAAILDEIAKCELVCSNCHAVRTRRRARKPAGKDASISEDQLTYRLA